MAAIPAMRLRDADLDVRRSYTQLAASCAMEANPTAPGQLRGFTGAVLAHWGVTGLAEYEIRAIVSELVTNAVVHSKSLDVSLTLTMLGHTVCLTVRDSGCWRRHKPDPDDEHGRGLKLVRLQATTSGVRLTPHGTHAWAQRVVPLGELQPRDEQGAAC